MTNNNGNINISGTSVNTVQILRQLHNSYIGETYYGRYEYILNNTNPTQVYSRIGTSSSDSNYTSSVPPLYNTLVTASAISTKTSDDSVIGLYFSINSELVFDVDYSNIYFIELNLLGISSLTVAQMDYWFSVYQNIKDKSILEHIETKEKLENKAIDFSTVNDTKYPTTKAVYDLKNTLLQLQSNNDGKKYKIVAGVIRNIGNGWELIEDTNHSNINVLSVTNDTSKITITYNFIAKKVISFVATPDETMSFDNLFMGASVGLNISEIEMFQNKSIGGYVNWSGLTWSFAGSSDQSLSASFNAGILTITHPTISGAKGNVSCRDGIYVANLGSLGDTTTTIYIRDYEGSLVTTENTNMGFYFERNSRNTRINPQTYTTAVSNIWIYGIMEVE